MRSSVLAVLLTTGLALACAGPADPWPCEAGQDCQVQLREVHGDAEVAAVVLGGVGEACPDTEVRWRSGERQALLAHLCGEDPAPMDDASVRMDGDVLELVTTTGGGQGRTRTRVRVDASTGRTLETRQTSATADSEVEVVVPAEGPPTASWSESACGVEGATATPVLYYPELDGVGLWERDLPRCASTRGEMHALLAGTRRVWVRAPQTSDGRIRIAWSDAWLGSCDASPSVVEVDEEGRVVEGMTLARAVSRHLGGQTTWRVDIPEPAHPSARWLGITWTGGGRTASLAGEGRRSLAPLAQPALGGEVCGSVGDTIGRIPNPEASVRLPL